MIALLKHRIVVRGVIYVSLMILFATLTGCGGTPRKEEVLPSVQNPTQVENTLNAINTKTLTIGFTPSNQEAVWLQENKKTLSQLADQPADATINWVSYASQERLLKGVVDGEVNAAYLDPVMAMRGYSLTKGSLSVVSGALSGKMALIGLRELPTEFSEQLKEKTVGVTELKSTDEVILKKLLKEKSLNPNQYHVKAFTGETFKTKEAIENALESGQYKAIMLSEPLLGLVKDSKKIRVLAEPETLFQNESFPSLVCVVNSKLIEDNPALVKSWIQLRIETIEELKDKGEVYKQLTFNPMSGILIKLTYLSLEFQAIKEEPMADQFYKLEILRDLLREDQLKSSPAS